MASSATRRSTVEQKHSEPPLYQAIADDVMELYNQGMLIGEIAERLDVHPATVKNANKFRHESRGLPVPDSRTRRNSLKKRSS